MWGRGLDQSGSQRHDERHQGLEEEEAATGCGQAPEARKGTETDSSLEPPERSTGGRHLSFSPVRTSDLHFFFKPLSLWCFVRAGAEY